MRRADLALGGVFAALGAGIFAASLAFPEGPGRLPGPGFFPGVVGAVIAALAALLVFRAARGKTEAGAAIENLHTLLLTLLLLAAYLALWGVVPFAPRTFVMLLLFLRIAGEPWKPAITVSGVLTAAVALAFQYGLRVTLE